MRRVVRSSEGVRWRVRGLVLASMAGVLLVPGVGHLFAAVPMGQTIAVPPVEIVLSYASLPNSTVLGGAPVALPISFGRPVAPEDEPTALPTRWHHKAVHRHARRWAGDGYVLCAMIVPRMDRVPWTDSTSF
jgi:hypothetical protein